VSSDLREGYDNITMARPSSPSLSDTTTLEEMTAPLVHHLEEGSRRWGAGGYPNASSIYQWDASSEEWYPRNNNINVSTNRTRYVVAIMCRRINTTISKMHLQVGGHFIRFRQEGVVFLLFLMDSVVGEKLSFSLKGVCLQHSQIHCLSFVMTSSYSGADSIDIATMYELT